MRCISTGVAGLLVWALVSPALARITVTSYQTVAQINGYAPTSQTQYFEQQTLTNISPAHAEVSGDWMGPNAGGGPTTWHYVGSAQTTSTTTFNPDTLTITAAGSFAYTVDTTTGFVDPSSSTVYPPGAAANYEALFNTDVPTTYTISAQLNQRGRVRLSSFEGLVVFDRSNPSPTPTLVNLSGTIPLGHYHVLITSGLATQLPSGVNHFTASGSYEDVVFTVQVPEPNALGIALAVIAGMTCRRRRSCAERG
jgi:hypothetical protein